MLHESGTENLKSDFNGVSERDVKPKIVIHGENEILI